MEEQTKITRREVLKALAAGGGALAAAAFLPAQWVKPVVKSGVLPAHAQSTICAELTDIGGKRCEQDDACPAPFTYVERFAYTPKDLTPGVVHVTYCGETIPTAWAHKGPGEFWVFYNPIVSVPGCEVVLGVSFLGGCVAYLVDDGTKFR